MEQGARHGADRTEWRRQDHRDQPAHRRAEAQCGRILLEGHDITDLPVHTRVLARLSRTFQINQLMPT